MTTTALISPRIYLRESVVIRQWKGLRKRGDAMHRSEGPECRSLAIGPVKT